MALLIFAYLWVQHGLEGEHIIYFQNGVSAPARSSPCTPPGPYVETIFKSVPSFISLLSLPFLGSCQTWRESLSPACSTTKWLSTVHSKYDVQFPRTEAFSLRASTLNCYRKINKSRACLSLFCLYLYPSQSQTHNNCLIF